MAGAVGQPTNATAQRRPVHGEVAATEEQMAGAPLGPEQRGRPPAPPTVEPVDVDLAEGPTSNVVPTRPIAQTPNNARPATREEMIASAVSGLGEVSPITRRLALGLQGIPQPGVLPEVLPRYMQTQPTVPTEAGSSVMAGAEAEGATAEQMVAKAEAQGEATPQTEGA